MIKFHNHGPYVLQNKKDVRGWLMSSVAHMNCKLGDINYIFCDNEQILEINKQYLNHDYTTDIITFDYSENKTLSADIYISIEQVRENKTIYNVTMLDELHRVMIHGILHLAGWQDKTEDQQKKMRKEEDYYLSLRTFL